MGIKAIGRFAPVHVVYTISAGEAADKQIFVADQDYEIVEVRETHTTAGASSSTLDVGVAASGTAAASLTTALGSTFALDSTADTPVTGTLTSTLANRNVDKGEQIALNYTGTVTNYEGALHIVLNPVRNRNTNY